MTLDEYYVIDHIVRKHMVKKGIKSVDEIDLETEKDILSEYKGIYRTL